MSALHQRAGVLDLLPIAAVELVTIKPVALLSETMREALAATPYVPPASFDDAIAREAVAMVEADTGSDIAAFRRHGCYDGDDEHQIALAAVRLTRANFTRESAPLEKVSDTRGYSMGDA